MTPTAVPSATAESQEHLLYYNSCVAPIYESLSRGVPYKGVCEREWVDGRYECRHHARDFCKAILDNGSNQAMGSGCWPLSVGIKSSERKHVRCLVVECGGGSIKEIRNPFRRAFYGIATTVTGTTYCRKEIQKEIQKCVDDKFYGHAINIFRSGGQEVLDRYGEVSFSVVEPQRKDGSSAVLCSWRQKTLEPVIPSDCKEVVEIEYFPEQVFCGLKYDFKVYGLDDWNAEVARQDKEMGFEIPKP